MNIFDENLTPEEIYLINQLKNKNRMEQDQIIGEFKNAKI